MSGIRWFYSSRYVHKIAPNVADVGPRVGLLLSDLDEAGKAWRSRVEPVLAPGTVGA